MYFDDYLQHPNATIRKSLFWDYNMANFDWEKMKVLVTKRVIERGRMQDFYGLLNLYGLEKVKSAIMQIPWLSDKDMNFAAVVFGLNKEDLLCYKRKQLRPQHWNS